MQRDSLDSPLKATEIDFPPELYRALEQLNARGYFECHETLEALWFPERRPIRQIYQGILQIAVGCYHLVSRANHVGAVNKLGEGAEKLESWPAVVSGVDLHDLARQARRLRDHLIGLGRERVGEYDPRMLPIVLNADSSIR